MNTKLIGVIIGVVVAGGAYYAISQRSGSEGTGSGAVAPAAQGGAFTGSLADLSARGGNWTCTIRSSADTGAGTVATEGTVHVSGARVRMDTMSEVPSVGPVESHMIADGEYAYAWTSAYPQGMKMRMTAGESGAGAAPSGQGLDANQAYSYDCMPSSSDEALFAIPADVQFMTL